MVIGLTAALGLFVATTDVPEIVMMPSEPSPCGQPATRLPTGEVRPLSGAAPGLCVMGGLAARLEHPDRVHVVLRVRMPEPVQPRDRLFIYELRGDRLLPRMLGTGPQWLRLRDVRRRPGAERDALWVSGVSRPGRTRSFRCALVGFPLICTEVEPPRLEPSDADYPLH